jgi:hypothetical protein
MTRWMKHLRTLPRTNQIGAAVCLVMLIAVIITLVIQISDLVADFRKEHGSKDVHGSAWGKTQPHLARADSDAAQAIDKHLATIHAFIDERKAGSRAFAESLLGLT